MAGETMQARVERVQEQIFDIIKEYTLSHCPPILQLRDQAVRLLRKEGLLRRQKTNGRYVAVHPRNRYGDGKIPSHVRTLVRSFCSDGFSMDEVGVPFAIEMPPPSHERHAEALEFNGDLVKDSHGFLPPYDEGEIKILSVSKSHTTQATRCIQFGSPTDSDTVEFGTDGKLDIHKIGLKRPTLADAAKEGFEWDVLVWQAEDAFGAIIDLLQESGNAAQKVSMNETRWETLFKMHGDVQKIVTNFEANKKEGDILNPDVAWGRAITKAQSRNPDFVSEIQSLATFARKLAGGPDAPNLKELLAFNRSCQKPRIVQGPVLAAVADAVIGSDGLGCIPVRIDCVKAMMSADSKYASGDFQNLFASGDFGLKLTSNKEVQSMISQADIMKSMAIDIAKTVNLSEDNAAVKTLINRFGMRLVHHCMKKPDPRSQKFESLHHIGYEYVQDLATIAGTQITSPWAKKGAPPRAPAQQAAASAQVQSVGGIADRMYKLASMGVSANCHIEVIKMKTVYKVQEVKEDEIKLQSIGDGSDYTVDSAYLLKSLLTPRAQEFTVITKREPKKDAALSPFHACKPARCDPRSNSDWQRMVLVCHVTSALDALGNLQGAAGEMVDIVTEPTEHRGVYAKVDIDVSSAIFPPFSTKVAFSDAAPDGAIDVGAEITNADGVAQKLYIFMKLQKHDPGGIADNTRGSYKMAKIEGSMPHYWLIDKEVTDPKKSNMAIKLHTVDASVGAEKFTLKIPFLENTKPIKKGDKLRALKPQAAKAPPMKRVRTQ
ncbi:unnamed protein product [Prorocentrum cordatum]|uniref:RNA-directed RNA polymerase n=1 Tax=Prorocentrum cordatum TaxID=2364126 RepID=A0ABN9RRB8_9DINO|nr:unnamed protein product [Polarella glacialis]